jgi:uncharacterized tellurite resistance protein B-like protein
MNWSIVLHYAWQTMNDWWPRVVIILGVLGGVWGMFKIFTHRVVWAIIKAGVLGQAQDSAENALLETMRKMVETEKEHHVAEVALVRTQIAEQLASKDSEIAALRVEVAKCAKECASLRAVIAGLRADMDASMRGDLASWDRRILRGGSADEREDVSSDDG